LDEVPTDPEAYQRARRKIAALEKELWKALHETGRNLLEAQTHSKKWRISSQNFWFKFRGSALGFERQRERDQERHGMTSF
jgi:hypothetical protein